MKSIDGKDGRFLLEHGEAGSPAEILGSCHELSGEDKDKIGAFAPGFYYGSYSPKSIEELVLNATREAKDANGGKEDNCLSFDGKVFDI